ncbi:MAG: hypothetical protein ACQERF_02085 [Actinomycetota bacterium]
MTGAKLFRETQGMDNEQKYPAIRDTDSLCRYWQIILEEQGRDTRTLWIGYLDDAGVRKPVIAGIEEMPPRPSAVDVDGLRTFLRHLPEVDGAPPFLMFSRPGPRHVTLDDHLWGGVLRDLQREAGVDRPVLRGVGTHVAPLPALGGEGCSATA